MNVLIILGHPRTASLCGALADAFGTGAREAGAEVRQLDLATLKFDPDVHTVSPNQQPFEDDLLRARELIRWAEHLVFVYPTWWGTMPALLRLGIGMALTAFMAATLWLLMISPASTAVLLSVLGVMTLLAIGYTAAPLKLCYRGLGEIDVAITHSIGVILCGYVFLGGAWDDPMPWLLSVPLLLAILPSITLSGIPDLEADAAAGKRTLAVRLGHRGALMVALVFTLLAAGAAAIWHAAGIASGAYAGIAWVALPHAAWLAWLLRQRMSSVSSPGRIDGLMAVSLTYVLWFGLIPLFRLP